MLGQNKGHYHKSVSITEVALPPAVVNLPSFDVECHGIVAMQSLCRDFTAPTDLNALSRGHWVLELADAEGPIHLVTVGVAPNDDSRRRCSALGTSGLP